MADTRAYLMVVDGYNPDTSSVQTLYFGTHGYTTKPTDTPANTYFEPRLQNPGLYSQAMYSMGTTGGLSSGGFGVIELVNTDGGLDDLLNWGFDSRNCIVYDGALTNSFSDFEKVMTGTIEQVEFTWGKISFRFKDRTLDVDKPIALHYYLGNNALPDGLEGVDDLKDKSKPRLFGSCFNISPALVNTSKLTYQINDGSITSISSVRDSGVPLVLGTAHANSTALQAATVAPGTYDTCLSEGYIRLGSTPAGQVTCDAVASTQSIGQAMAELATEKLGSGFIKEDALAELDASIPSSVIWGYYVDAGGSTLVNGITSGVTTKTVLDELSNVGVWWSFDNNGMLWLSQFKAPDSLTPNLYLDESNIWTIERTATNDSDKGLPVWKVTCKYRRNFTVQSQVAGSIDQKLYATDWKEVSYSDDSIKVKNPLAAEVIIESPFVNESDALAEATRQFNLRSVRRDRLRIETQVMYKDIIAKPPLETDGWLNDFPNTPNEVNNPVSDGYSSNHTAIIADNYIWLTGYGTNCCRLDLTNIGGGWEYDVRFKVYPQDVGWIYSTAIVKIGRYLYSGVVNFETSLQDIYRLNLDDVYSGWQLGYVTTYLPYSYEWTFLEYGGYLYALRLSAGYRISTSNLLGTWEDLGWTAGGLSWSDNYYFIHRGFLYCVCKNYNTASYAYFRRKSMSNLSASWQVLANYPEPKMYPATVVCGGYVYLIGGIYYRYGAGQATKDVYRFNLNDPSGGWEMFDYLYPEFVLIQGAVVSYNNELIKIGAASSKKVYSLKFNYNPEDYSDLMSMGKTAIVTLPRYDYNSGKPMFIMGAETDHSNRKTILDLWG